MDNKNDLNIEILNILLDANKPMTVDEIKTRVSKSAKTVRNHLNQLSLELNMEGIKLVKKPNVGIYLDVNQQEKNLLKDNYIRKIQKCEVYDTKYRKQYILEILLINKFNYTMQMFADELYCSKGTIVNDLVDVEDWLETHSLNLKRRQNQGLWIEGSEIDFRKGIMDFFQEMDRTSSNEPEIDFEEMDYRLSIKNYYKLKEFFPDVDLLKIQKHIKQSEEKLGYSFTDQAFINLLAHIAITIKRVRAKQEIIMPKDFNEKLQNTETYHIAQELVRNLQTALDLKFPVDETGYICLHMLGAKIQENITDENYRDILGNQDDRFINLAKEIIKATGKTLGVDLNGDEILLTSLVLHIRPIVIRLENGLKLKNPMLDTIKNEYTSVFAASWIASTIFEKECGVMINEDEVAYIAMHIAAALERSSKDIKTLIVCSSGIGTAQLIRTKLVKRFHNLEIIGVISVEKLNKEIIEGCDLIVSTVPYNIDTKKAVYVSALLSNEDIFKINKFIGGLKEQKEETVENSKVNENFRDVISEDYCFIESNMMTYDEIIKKYGEILIKSGYAKKGYIQSVLSREKKSSTYVGKGISIPHSATEYVSKSKIAAIKLQKPILNRYETIDIIFLLCIKIEGYEMATDIFSEFYSMLDNEEYIGQLKAAQTSEQMNSLLRRFNYGKFDK